MHGDRASSTWGYHAILPARVVSAPLGAGGAGRPTRQRGAVLIVAMILLLVLTLLGVSAMNTSQLEERMAANSQEFNRAFQSAESGLSMAVNSNTAYNLNGASQPPAGIPGATSGLQAGWASTFLAFSPPPPGSLFISTKFHAANFDFASVGTTGGGLTVTVHGGAYQIAPKAN